MNRDNGYIKEKGGVWYVYFTHYIPEAFATYKYARAYLLWNRAFTQNVMRIGLR